MQDTMTLAAVPDIVSAKAQAAWRDYLAVIDAARAQLLNSRWSRSPGFQTQAMQFISLLQQFGFNTYLGPRPAFPSFYQHLMFTPVEHAWGAPCPDFRYHWTVVDGARTYRIWGRRGNTLWLNIQAQRGWYGDENSNVGSWDVDDFELAADGSFEIIASPNPQPGNWIKLDPTAPYTCMLVRDIWDDWDDPRGATIHIECLDPPPAGGLFHDEDEFCRRLGKIGRQTQVSVDFFLGTLDAIFDEVGFNRFRPLLTRGGEHAGSPSATYIHLCYDIRPDEALIVECALPQTPYWSLHMCDWLQQTTDYRFHHTSLNGRQAHVGPDKVARLVICAQDPGVRNWLDTCGQQQGIALWRYYLADQLIVPTTRKVPLAQLRSHLPADTALTTADQRRALLAWRQRRIGERFNV
jgi:hypothetical protein